MWPGVGGASELLLGLQEDLGPDRRGLEVSGMGLSDGVGSELDGEDGWSLRVGRDGSEGPNGQHARY